MENKLNTFLEKSHVDIIGAIIIVLVIFIKYWELNFMKIFGILISLIGFVVWIIAMAQLGKSFQIKVEAKQLVTSGIYSKIRHPIYLGGIFVVIGDIIYTIGTFLNVLLIIYLLFAIIVQYYRIKSEERVLTNKFKRKYLNYKRKTWF